MFLCPFPDQFKSEYQKRPHCCLCQFRAYETDYLANVKYLHLYLIYSLLGRFNLTALLYWRSGATYTMYWRSLIAWCASSKLTDGNFRGGVAGIASTYDVVYFSDLGFVQVREITFHNAEELTEEGLPFLLLFHNREDTESLDIFEREVSKLAYLRS